MSKRKVFGTIIGIMLYVGCIVFFTYAFYSWKSDNSIVDLSIIEQSLEVKFENGEDVNAENIGPVLDYNIDGEATTFKIFNPLNENLEFNLSLDITTISDNLKNETFKYILLVDTSGGTEYTEEVISGNFSNLDVGSNSLLQASIVNSNSVYSYKFIVYIDGNVLNNNNLQGNNLESNLVITQNSLLLSFDPNGGTVDETEKAVYFGATYGDLPTPTRTGYTFNGWATATTNGEQITSESIVSESDDHTLYAMWTVNSYTITFNANSGTGTMDDFTYNYETGNFTLPTSTFTRTGYTISKWRMYRTDIDKWYGCTDTSVGCTSSAGNTTMGWWSSSEIGTYYEPTANSTWGFSSTVHTYDMVFYAQWTANTYTVTFNANGGSVTTTSKSVTYASTYGTLPTPTRSNYTFSGWYTAASGGTKVTSSSTVTITAAQTLYAQWTENKVTIKFKVNGGTVTTTTTSDEATTYTWTTDSSGYIYRASNGGTSSILTNTVKYGATIDLPNYANDNYLKITRSGYIAVTDEEWKCLSGCTTSGATFDQTVDYSPSDFCSIASGNCEVTLGVNWKQQLGPYLLNTLKPTGLVTTKTYGGLYRFQGTSANNYICFGTSTKSTCTGSTDKYMYRIIGINSSGQLKLIKKEALNSELIWNGDKYVLWNEASLYTKLNGSTFYTNTTYVPSTWKSKIASKSWKYGDVSSNSSYNGSTAYTTEKALTTTVSNYIGLMHISDVLLAYSGGNPGSNTNVEASWIFLWSSANDSGAPNDRYEWLILRKSSGSAWLVNSSGYVSDGSMGAGASVRPVFYLSSKTVFLSGTGTLSNPFIIS